jgi:hypothetical protein
VTIPRTCQNSHSLHIYFLVGLEAVVLWPTRLLADLQPTTKKYTVPDNQRSKIKKK